MKLFKFYLGFLWRFLRYYWQAATKYDVHSPFVADFVEYVLEDRREFYAFSDIREVRESLLHDRRPIRITDYGAGSQARPEKVRTIKSIARFGAVSPATGRLIFSIARHYQAKNILELGTSLGLSTLYLASPNSSSEIITIEGCPETAAVAEHHFQTLHQKNIESLVGPFRERLPEALSRIDTLDLLFLDGDHRRGASLEYFEQCLAKAHNDSVFVIADIHWSPQMERAWNAIRRHPRVRISIDLFHLGVLFFRREHQQPEHFTLIQARYKPWHMGLFPASGRNR